MSDVIRNCPKCGAEPDLYQEEYTAALQFDIEDGEILRDQHNEVMGGITRVKAICGDEDCEHEWTLRGINDIDDLCV